MLNNFSIEQICDSGQCFRMTKLDDGAVEVIAMGKYLKVYQNGDKVTFMCDEDDFKYIWSSYFDLNTDYGMVIDSIDKNDSYLINAAEFGKGIRILNQDLWEMIISFIISQRNNIKRIRKCIASLCEAYGEKVIYTCEDGEITEYYDFPKADVLAKADINDLMKLSVGYRAEYILRAARDVASGAVDLKALELLDYKKAKEKLLQMYGVGNKVADCICLFALHHVDAFPMDTHMIYIVDNEYEGSFPLWRYPGCAGILQQYMFYYDLNKRS